jgi:AraC-like DNA-binding protein
VATPEFKQALHRPRSPLNDYIKTLWWHEIPSYHGRELILPSPYIELIVNLGEPHKVFLDEELREFDWQPDAWLAGMQTHYLAIESSTSHMIGARFRPGGAHAFLEQPVSALTDRVAPLSELWPDAAPVLLASMRAAASSEARFQIFEDFLMSKLRAPSPSFALVSAAIERLQASRGQAAIQDVSTDLGVSQKHLGEEFRSLVGVRPKQYARMLRFSTALAELDPSKPVEWNQLAHKAEFYDQPHFINEFKAFTGLTPTEYQSLWQRLKGQMGDFDPRFVPMG